MTKATRARYTLVFKQEAVRLVESGQSIAAASRTLGLVEQTLFNWVKAHRGGTLKGAESRSKVTAEQISVIDPARSAVGAVRFLWMMPALFMSTSSLGNPIFTRVASVAICAGSATSLWIVWSFGCLFFTSSSTDSCRPVTITVLPSSTNLSAKQGRCRRSLR